MDHRDPEWLVHHIGLTRLLRLLSLTEGDLSLVYPLHQHDFKVRSAFRAELEVLEVATRSRYHNVILNLRPTGPDWMLDPALPVHRILRGFHEQVYRQLAKGGLNIGEAAERLSFGFWATLTEQRYEKDLWRRYLRHVYPAGSQRENIHRRVNMARIMRNSTSHLHVVVDQPTRKQWQNILWLLDRLNPHIAEERRSVSELPGLLS